MLGLLRTTLTQLASEGRLRGTPLHFLSALAQQCHMNGYIYSYNKFDQQIEQELESQLCAHSSRTAAEYANSCYSQLLALWAYRPIECLPYAKLLEDSTLLVISPEPLLPLLQHIHKAIAVQVSTQRFLEAQSAPHDCSTEVRSLYEKYPYPRCH